MVKIKVQCVEDDDLDLDDGDYIVFAEVEGMPGLNDQMPLPVLDVSKGKKSFIMAVPAAAAAGTFTPSSILLVARGSPDVTGSCSGTALSKSLGVTEPSSFTG